jgi:hypothetical protein
LKSEVTTNTVLNGGVVSMGKNEPKITYNLLSSWPVVDYEPGKTGTAHLHPFYKTVHLIITDNNGVVTFDPKGGHPSGIPSDGKPGDIQEHRTQDRFGQVLNGVRSIMVDEKNIYLYNGNADQIITIPRPR